MQLNKLEFEISLSEEDEIVTEKITKKGSDAQIIKLLKAISKCKTFTDDQDKLVNRMKNAWEEGNIPASITKEVLKQVKDINDPIKIFYEIIDLVPYKYFEERKAKKKINISGDLKVILSSYLSKGDES